MASPISCSSLVCDAVSLFMTVLQLGQFVPQHFEMAFDRSVAGVSPWLLFFNTLYNFLAAVDLLMTSPLTLATTLHKSSFSLYRTVIAAQPHIQMIGSFVLSFAMWYWYLRYANPNVDSGDDQLNSEPPIEPLSSTPVAAVAPVSHVHSELDTQNITTSSSDLGEQALKHDSAENELHHEHALITITPVDASATSTPTSASDSSSSSLPAPLLHFKWIPTTPLHVFSLQNAIMLTVVVAAALPLESLRALFAHGCGMVSTAVNALMWVPQLTMTLGYGHRGALSLQWVMASFVMDVTYSLYLWALGVHWSVWANNIPDALFTAILSVVLVRYDMRDRARGLDGFGRRVRRTSAADEHGYVGMDGGECGENGEQQPLVVKA